MRRATVLLLELLEQSQRHAAVFTQFAATKKLLGSFMRTCGDAACQARHTTPHHSPDLTDAHRHILGVAFPSRTFHSLNSMRA